MLRFNTGTHALEGNVNANFHTAEFLVARCQARRRFRQAIWFCERRKPLVLSNG